MSLFPLFGLEVIGSGKTEDTFLDFTHHVGPEEILNVICGIVENFVHSWLSSQIWSAKISSTFLEAG
jgi:hypothetical protein